MESNIAANGDVREKPDEIRKTARFRMVTINEQKVDGAVNELMKTRTYVLGIPFLYHKSGSDVTRQGS
ncbi:MAG TPA: hypothetical protein VER55_05595 [Ardenticatenaceae bacterium]|nr:hypothetical protein [Ardenticatenaceae bacterium]